MGSPSNLVSLADILAAGLWDIRHIRYSELASSSIIIYEHIITLDQEIELIWRAPWSIGKIFFIVNRYFGLLSVIFNNYALFAPTLTDSFCLQWFQWQGWTGLIACMIAEAILQGRLYALYFYNKKILCLMIVNFLGAAAASATVMGSVLSNITATAHPAPGVNFCVAFGVPSYFYTFWIPMLAFESLLCGLALFRGFQTLVLDGSVYRSGRRLVSILIRDSVMYFLIMFATYLTNLLFWITAPVNLLEIPVGFSLSLSCVMANRIIFNVRSVNQNSPDEKSSSRHFGPHDEEPSFFTPSGVLTQWEIFELRRIHSDQDDYA